MSDEYAFDFVVGLGIDPGEMTQRVPEQRDRVLKNADENPRERCVAAGANVILLLVLSAVWGRNYLQLRSKHALGLLLFAVLLLGENSIALYYSIIAPTLSAWFDTQVPVIVWRVMLAFHVLEPLAIGFLTWITLN